MFPTWSRAQSSRVTVTSNPTGDTWDRRVDECRHDPAPIAPPRLSATGAGMELRVRPMVVRNGFDA